MLRFRVQMAQVGPLRVHLSMPPGGISRKPGSGAKGLFGTSRGVDDNEAKWLPASRERRVILGHWNMNEIAGPDDKGLLVSDDLLTLAGKDIDDFLRFGMIMAAVAIAGGSQASPKVDFVA